MGDARRHQERIDRGRFAKYINKLSLTFEEEEIISNVIGFSFYDDSWSLGSGCVGDVVIDWCCMVIGCW